MSERDHGSDTAANGAVPATLQFYQALSTAERSRWIVAQRDVRHVVDPAKPHGWLVEEERMEDGSIARVGTVFLANRECPWKCLMCDLWQNTTEGPVAAGAISGQIRLALEHLPKARVLKLYNAGSFFDQGAIPRDEWNEIARLCREFEHVIVECHPRLVGPRVLEFAAMLEGTLEVAMGLETADARALEWLNKRFSLEDYARAVSLLRQNQVAVRSFILVPAPFAEFGSVNRTIEFALDLGSNVVSLIPLRVHTGALQALGATEPKLSALEEAQEHGFRLNRGRVFADTWDLSRFSDCPKCAAARAERIHRMNLTQRLEARVSCDCPSGIQA